MLVMTGRQVVERPRLIHSKMHEGRDSGESFVRSVKAHFSSNAVHSLRSSAHRLPNGGSPFWNMLSEFKNQAGGDGLVDNMAEDEALRLSRGCVLPASCELVGCRADDDLFCL